ncbi:MAG: aquaporin family protein [Burkholderiales bacterium]|nr:aquaporin family protein [Burkholderiales bacterium]
MQNKTLLRECMAELIGTMVILLFGNGVCAMNTLFNLGGYVNISFGWGLAVLFGILISTRISGAHLNPSVTLALVITKRFSIHKMPFYMLSQMIGAFLGAALVYYFYEAKLTEIDPNLSSSAGIFTTFPAVNAFMPSIMAEIIATAILLFGILAIVDHFTLDKASFFSPFAVALLIVGIGMSFGGMHGYGINPARDFSPRLLITLLKFQHTGLNDDSYIWVHGVLGPLIGGPIGALVYDYTIGKKVTSERILL